MYLLDWRLTLAKKRVVLSGEVFNKLTVIEEVENSPVRQFKMLCECGNTLIVRLGNLVTGHTKSCGCYADYSHLRIHGKAKTKVYKTWIEMRERCYNPNRHNYNDYGGRGIKVCDEWLGNFLTFCKDIGEPPTKQHSIERLDVDGDYCPSNVIWADQSTQNRNRRRFRNNSSGVTGVSLRERSGSTYYIAGWLDLNGIEHRRSFSGNKYGDELALFMACQCREHQIELLNLKGAGYSEKHGL